MQNYLDKEQEENSIDLKAELFKYLVHWRSFLVSIIVIIALAVLYLKFASKIYDVNTTILIKEDNKSDLTSQLTAFSDFGFGGSKNNIENEIEILKSRTLTEKVIDSLKLEYTYFNEDSFTKKELYNNSPLILEVTNFDTSITVSTEFIVDNIKENSFEITVNEKKIGSFKFNENIKTLVGDVTITKNNAFIKSEEDKDIERLLIYYSPKVNVAANLLSRVSISPTSKTSSVLNISVKSDVPQKATDYLNTLVDFYNIQGIADKKYISQNTSEFISNRLNIIAEELGDVEKNVEGYKNVNSLTDIQSEVKLFLDNLSSYERLVIENETEINITNELIKFLQKANTYELIPNIASNNDSGINSSINELNKIILERQRLLTSSTEENPSIVKLENLITSSKDNILSSLKNSLKSLNITKNDLKGQERDMQAKLAQVPRQEREFRIIDRQQKVKEALYLFLLQKREETNITLAATELNAKVIDKAIVPTKHISPKSSIILLGAFIMGILIPFVIIYLTYLFDTKIKTRNDIEGKTNIPFLGDVPTSDSSNEIMEVNSRSSSAEALRIIRTNLEFMISDLPKNESKVIFCTSTFPGEGKTFISANTAATFAISEKKTLLIGMDIRNPKLDEYFNLPNKGLTNYLSNKDADINDYIVSLPNFTKFDVLPAGTVPPNPAELLMSSKLEKLFSSLREKYDYIIVDTAPVSLVTDTILVAKYADTFVYVIRSGKLDKKFLEVPESLYKENKLPRMCLLLNDTNSTKGYGYGYGYRYGYAYGIKKEIKHIPLWKKILGVK